MNNPGKSRKQALRRPDMKTLANRFTMFAASALVLGTMAYGQTQTKVEIPFAFSAGKATLPPGSYLFYRQTLGSVTLTILESATSHHSVLAVGARVDPNDRPSQPSFVFACVSGNCSLSAVKMASGTLIYAAPKKAAREQGALVSFISIPITTRNGD
jgi:hypothetical protein